MSLTFETRSRIRPRSPTIIHDVYLPAKGRFAGSEVLPAVCDICSKGIRDRYTLHAKMINDELVLLCDVHIES